MNLGSYLSNPAADLAKKAYNTTSDMTKTAVQSTSKAAVGLGSVSTNAMTGVASGLVNNPVTDMTKNAIVNNPATNMIKGTQGDVEDVHEEKELGQLKGGDFTVHFYIE